MKEYTNDAIDVSVDYLNYRDIFDCMNVYEKALKLDVSGFLATVWVYSIVLLTLKLVWKCFDTYMIGSGGDDDANPIMFLISYAKALFLNVSFGFLYSSFFAFAQEATDDLLRSLNVKNVTITSVLEAFVSNTASAFFLLVLFIYAICAFVLNIKFQINGAQLFILRSGISFSTVGLIDSDGGVFKPFIKKFFQIGFTVVVQVISFKISLLAMSTAHIIIGLAFLGFAMTAPAFLSEFLLTNQGGGNKLMQAYYSYSFIRSLVK